MIIYYGPVTLYLINMNFKPVGFFLFFMMGMFSPSLQNLTNNCKQSRKINFIHPISDQTAEIDQYPFFKDQTSNMNHYK